LSAIVIVLLQQVKKAVKMKKNKKLEKCWNPLHKYVLLLIVQQIWTCSFIKIFPLTI